MTESLLTQDKGLQPDSEHDLSQVLFKHEMMKTLMFNGCFAFLLIAMILFSFITTNTFKVDALPVFILFMLMLITTIETIFIRLGNVIADHPFYKAWLIAPIVNIITLSLIVTFLCIYFTDAFNFDNTGFFIACLMGSMVFIHTAFVVRRTEPEYFQFALEAQDYNEKKVYMSKKKFWAYRLTFGSLTFITMFVLRSFFS